MGTNYKRIVFIRKRMDGMFRKNGSVKRCQKEKICDLLFFFLFSKMSKVLRNINKKRLQKKVGRKNERKYFRNGKNQ